MFSGRNLLSMRQLTFGFMRKKRGLDKYTEAEIASWVEAFRGGKSYRQVADDFGANYSTVFWHIKKQCGVSGRRPGRRKVHVGKSESEVGRMANLRNNYGMTVDQYDAMLVAQGGVCAICGLPQKGGKTSSVNLHVDHDHATSKIRGLLCHNHNVGLGHFQDDPGLLERAAAYLRSHQ